jgi:hypothetical protein
MSEKINKLATILLWVLMGLTVVFAIFYYMGRVVPGTEGTRYEEPKITNSFIFYAYILFGLTVLVTIFFGLTNLIQNPKGLRVFIVALVAVAVLIGIAALMADNTVLNLPNYKGNDNVPSTLFWTDVGLFVAYFLLILAVLAIVYSMISKYFKK